MAVTKEHLQALNGFLAKSDGKDKLTALVQYACMFISAGEPGNVRKVQASVTAARKVFRIMRPFESIMPLINNPGFAKNKPPALEALNKLKLLLMAIYFAADHVVWAGQAGILTDKQALARYQKVSLYSWAGGSVCTMVTEAYELLQLSKLRRKGETDSEWTLRQAKAMDDVNKRLLVLIHALFQAALAAGLLQLFPWKPRTVGFLGVVASAMNCYFLFPTLPARVSAPAPKAVGNSKDPLPVGAPSNSGKVELKKA